ncbi:MAG: DNA polymerase III subunit gamma/tau [Agarilytica sp.]
MSYQVLARKWRPRIFREMVGQEHVLKALINALDHDRLHHAYLFTGTRGVGKTTIARILAKCLNCETGVSSEPCGECSSCVEIAEGRFVDLIEVDAASRTKVEDTRELLDNVQYAPTRGRYKIYLIDEVHMLSNHSFNALLKTLEEPPEHVKFLLATTDPQKLPVTILSRCLQFNLKNLSPERIVSHLDHVLCAEVIPFEQQALWLLARSADGSMRDALSLTDQAIAFGSGKVLEEETASMLGTIDHVLIEEIMSALVVGDGPGILAAIAKFSEHAPDYDAALADLLTLLHRIAIAQALPEALDNSYGDREQILKFAHALTPENTQLFYQTALVGRRDLPLASDMRSGLEMTLLRMLAFKPQGLVDVPKQTLSNQQTTASEAPSVQETSESLTEVIETEKKPLAEGRPPQEAPLVESQKIPPAQVNTNEIPVGEPRHTEQHRVPVETVENNIRAVKPALNTVGENAPVDVKNSENKISTEDSDPENLKKEAPLSAQKIALDSFEPKDWISLYKQMNVRGIVQSTAANTVLVGREENHLQFILDQDKTSLFDPSHNQRLADLLSDYFQHPVKVDIQLAVLPSELETPAQFEARKRYEAHQEALQKLKQDPVVQTLEREFSAVLQEDSVKYNQDQTN